MFHWYLRGNILRSFCATVLSVQTTHTHTPCRISHVVRHNVSYRSLPYWHLQRVLNNVDLQQRVLYRRLHKSYSSVLTRVRGVPRVLCYVVKRFLKKRWQFHLYLNNFSFRVEPIHCLPFFYKQEAQLMLTNLRDAFSGQSRSPYMVPFDMLDMVSY